MTARRTGRNTASSAMAHNRSPAAAKTATLPGATPKRKLRKERAEIKAVIAPMVMRMSMIRMTWRRTSSTILGARGTKSDANAELYRSLADAAREETVDADAAEEQCQSGEESPESEAISRSSEVESSSCLLTGVMSSSGLAGAISRRVCR